MHSFEKAIDFVLWVGCACTKQAQADVVFLFLLLWSSCELIKEVNEDDGIYRAVTPSVSEVGKIQDFILLASRRPPYDKGWETFILSQLHLKQHICSFIHFEATLATPLLLNESPVHLKNMKRFWKEFWWIRWPTLCHTHLWWKVWWKQKLIYWHSPGIRMLSLSGRSLSPLIRLRRMSTGAKCCVLASPYTRSPAAWPRWVSVDIREAMVATLARLTHALQVHHTIRLSVYRKTSGCSW